MNRMTAYLSLSLAIAGAAQAQQLSWTQRLDTPTSLPYHNREVAIGVNRQGSDVIVAWIHDLFDEQTNAYDSEVWYSVSTNGTTFTAAAPIPLPEAHVPGTAQGGDPMVAFSRSSGEGWVGALDNSSVNGGFFVCKKSPGSASAATGTEAFFGVPSDKGLFAVGPAFGGPELIGMFCNGKFRESGQQEDTDRLQAKTSLDGGANCT
jgi:hypothetical protein